MPVLGKGSCDFSTTPTATLQTGHVWVSKCDGHGRTTQDPPEEDPIASVPPGLPQLQSWPAGGRLPCPRAVATSSLPLGPGCDCSVGTSVPEPSAHSCFYGPWSPGVHRRAIPNTRPAQQTASGEPKLPQARGLYSRGRQRSRLSKHRCPSCRDRAPPPLLAGEQNNHAGPGEASCSLWSRVLSSGGALVTVCT